MGIPVTITEEVIGRGCRRDVDGAFQWDLKQTSSWKPKVIQTLFKGDAKGKYDDMEKEHRMLQKLMQECFLLKGGGVDTLSLEHKVFSHFLIKFEKINLPRYIFHHMLWALRKSQEKNRAFIPYGRLLSEIFHQGGMLSALKMSKAVNDDDLGTTVGKYLNGTTLYNMHLIKVVDKKKTDLKESRILSDLMDGFPPICKQDPIDVQENFVYDHWQRTGETIKYDDIPETILVVYQLLLRKESPIRKQLQKLLMIKKLLNLNLRKPRRIRKLLS